MQRWGILWLAATLGVACGAPARPGAVVPAAPAGPAPAAAQAVPAAPAQQPESTLPAGLLPEEQMMVRVARQITPTVVSVTTDRRLGGGSGSGVIVREDGLILTNAHVVGNARVVTIGLADGRRLEGQVLGLDRVMDIAVVRVAARGLPAAPMGDSDLLEVGQRAIAIGNPLGLERTVTTGIISAVNVHLEGTQLEGMVQTDAAINPGNSGGPLVDSQGRLIGINTAIRRGAVGLGFAVPIAMASHAMQQIVEHGRVLRAFLGIGYGDVTPEIAARFQLPARQGVVISEVVPGGPAARAGMRPGDLVVGIDGVEVRQGADLRRVLRTRLPGEVITLSLLREGRALTVQPRLVEARTTG
jgi:S1-C subfamily serine protease